MSLGFVGRAFGCGAGKWVKEFAVAIDWHTVQTHVDLCPVETRWMRRSGVVQ